MKEVVPRLKFVDKAALKQHKPEGIASLHTAGANKKTPKPDKDMKTRAFVSQPPFWSKLGKWILGKIDVYPLGTLCNEIIRFAQHHGMPVPSDVNAFTGPSHGGHPELRYLINLLIAK